MIPNWLEVSGARPKMTGVGSSVVVPWQTIEWKQLVTVKDGSILIYKVEILVEILIRLLPSKFTPKNSYCIYVDVPHQG